MQKSFPSKYPHLFQEVTWPWGPARARFVLLDSAPPASLISNVNLVPYTGSRWVMIRLTDGAWDLPGGTLEPGEDYSSALHRELMEEAGAQLISFQVIGAWHCISLADKPYRPHLPFPEYYRLVGMGEIEIVSAPLNPAGGEQVDLVESVSLETAVARFLSSQKADLAELYQLACELRR
ncbi:MAG: NUDIX hydrolase [Omnitrophica WOR_2 bacterium]